MSWIRRFRARRARPAKPLWQLLFLSGLTALPSLAGVALRWSGDPTHRSTRLQMWVGPIISVNDMLPELPHLKELLGRDEDREAQRLFRGKLDPQTLAVLEPLEGVLDGALWPVDEGRFVRGFGSGSSGYHLAVDIQADTGAEVRAAADGVIGYAGSALRGYGKMAMLVHKDGFVTLYAHLSKYRVQTGTVVRKGTPIGEVGSTGIARGPHLHFELIDDGRRCDPLPLFRDAQGNPIEALRDESPVSSRFEDVVEIDASGEAVTTSRPVLRCRHRRRHPESRYHRHAEASEGETSKTRI